MTPPSAEDHHIFRKGVGILLYLAPERPDIMYVLKTKEVEHETGEPNRMRYGAVETCSEVSERNARHGSYSQEELSRKESLEGERKFSKEWIWDKESL